MTPEAVREAIAADEAAGWSAACMTPVEWAEWRRLNPVRLVPFKGTRLAARPSEDCPLGFAADMRADGRCNGTPGGVADDEEEELEVVHEIPDRQGRQVVVAVTAPCGSCAHAPVCRLREAVERARSIQASAPEIDAAVTYELAATVTCRHYSGDGAQARPKRQMSPEGRASIKAAAVALAARRRADREAAGA